jgi:hypothetical protein
MQKPDLMTRLEQLKNQVMRGKDFFKTFDYFLRLTENEELISEQINDSVKFDKLHALLEQIVLGVLKKDRLQMTRLIILQVRGTSFFHGGFAVENSTFSFLFFEDMGMGLLAFARPGDPETHILRITCQLLGTGPLFN